MNLVHVTVAIKSHIAKSKELSLTIAQLLSRTQGGAVAVALLILTYVFVWGQPRSNRTIVTMCLLFGATL